MTAPDIGNRVRWTLDLYTDSLDEDGDPQPANYVVVADGAGNNEYVDPVALTGTGGLVPVFLASGDTFVVPANRQQTFAMTIDNEGTLEIDGYLVMVD